jgi:hypothetical protein
MKTRLRPLVVFAVAAAAGLIALGAQLTVTPGHPISHVAVGGGAQAASSAGKTPDLLRPAAAVVAGSVAGSAPPGSLPPGSLPPASLPPVPLASTAPVAKAPGVAAAPSTAKPRDALLPAAVPVTGDHAIVGRGLWLMARDGSGLRRVSADEPAAVAWSPDDRHLVVGHLAPGLYGGDPVDPGSLDIVDVADGSSRRLLAFANPIGWLSLSWSPDGRRIAASVNWTDATGFTNHVLVIDAATGTATTLGPGSSASWSATGCLGWVFRTVEIWCPGGPVSSRPPVVGSSNFVWSPAGDRYAVPSSDDATPGSILTYAADGTGLVDLGDLDTQALAWVGDGRSILFQTHRDLGLLGQPVGGGPARVLADPSAFAVNGVDDGIIVGTGREVGPRAIVSITLSDPTPHQLASVASAGDVVGTLTWTRDGRWVIAKVVRSY